MKDKLRLADMGGWSAEYEGLGSSEAHAIANSDGQVVAIAVTRSAGVYPPEATSIARRIVACCNVCDGISTGQLESDFAQGYEPWGHVQHLRAQLDELRKAAGCALALCYEAADFRNGVTDPTGAIDEGSMRAVEVLRDLENAIKNASGTA